MYLDCTSDGPGWQPGAIPVREIGKRGYLCAGLKSGMIRAMIWTSRITLTACLIGLAFGLLVACAAPSHAPDATPLETRAIPWQANTLHWDTEAQLYTRTPFPTLTPVQPTPTLSPQNLYQEGLDQRGDWNLDAALERFNAALDLAPDLLPVYASRAELYRLAGNYDEAAADLARALSLDSGSVQAWREKAWLHREEAAWDEALLAVNQLIQLQPDDGIAYILRAQVYAEGLGELRLALADYERAIACDPLFEQATLVERWHIQAALGRWDEALHISRQVFTTASKSPLRYYYQAWSLIQLGRLDDAIQILFFGLRRYPDYPVALYYALGVAYYERQAWSEAVQALDVVLAQSGASFNADTPWQHLGITAADILGRMGAAYLALEQCETGAAMVERAAADDFGGWSWASERVEACYVALTPTPEPQY
jgi:tetratricopeptide (TPR) repeat protein